MKTYIICFIAILTSLSLSGQTWTWDSLVISDGPTKLVRDKQDRIYTYTQHRNVLTKYTSSGNLLWQKWIPAQVEFSRVICDTYNNVYVLGTFFGLITIDSQSLYSPLGDDIFIAKLNQNGNLIWLEQISSKGTDYAGDICLDKMNKLLITGSTSDTTTFSNSVVPKGNSRDLFVAKYDLSGNYENSFFASFINCLGSDCGSSGLEIESDNNNDIILLAGINGKVQLDTAIYEGGHAGYFIKLDSAFKIKWSRVTDASYASYAGDLMINSANEIIYTFNQDWNYAWYGLLKKLSPDGISDTAYFSEKMGHIYGIDLDSLDNIYFAGEYFNYSFSGTPPTEAFMHFGKVGPNGGLDWLIVDSAYSWRAGFDIAVCANSYFVAGEFSDSLSLYNDLTTSQSYQSFLGVFQMGLQVGINNSNTPSDMDFIIYPNPSQGQLTMKINDEELRPVLPKGIINVYNGYGQCVYSQKCSNSNTQHINVCGFPKGIYFIEVNADKGRQFKKIIIQ